MITSNNITTYPFVTMLISKGKKSFENIGRFLKKSGDTASRMLRPGKESLEASQKIAQKIFENKKNLLLIIDESTIKKIYSQKIEGTWSFFNTSLGRCIKSYRFIAASISDGKFNVPISTFFSFGKEFYKNASQAQELTVKFFINLAVNLFPKANFVVTLDGAFAKINLLKWALENNIALEVRMHSNRVVKYKGEKQKIREIKGLKPKGRQMARTISVIWKDLPLEITAVRRINKHGNETIIYQAATYKTAPKVHAQNYKWRWNIEKMFRTTKQSFGLQECFSVKISVQYKHLCAVLLAYSIAQFTMKKYGYDSPEKALKALEKKNRYLLNSYKDTLDRYIVNAYA